MRMVAFDIEVFIADWFVSFQDFKTKEYITIHNNNYALKEYMRSNPLLVGFNNKHYDNHILKALLHGADNALIKEINDFIIIGRNLPWEHWFVQESRAWLRTFDIRDDMQRTLSLEVIGGHLGLPIRGTPVPFDIDRPLTEEEVEKVIRYNRYDVELVMELVQVRKDYLNGKLSLGKMKGLEPHRALYSTNAKATAMFLGANKKEHHDERNYEYPDNLNKELIPAEAFDFFDKLQDTSIPDEEIFKSKLTFPLQHLTCTLGFGGIHGAIPNYSEEATDDRVIVLYDVQSYYPSLMIQNDYISRNIPDPDFFKRVYHDRLEAKANQNWHVSDTYKLVLNTTYGAMLDKYNNLYDPKMGRSVCISGQLYLLELAMEYIQRVDSVRIIQLNTDGITISVDEKDLRSINTVNFYWEQRTGFVLEQVDIRKLVQSDVNNYIAVLDTDYIETKGGWLVYGISLGSGWSINNTFPIVKKALINQIVHDIPIEQTVNDSDDIFDFQIIARAGRTYTHIYWDKNGQEVPTQAVNRVYASKDKTLGKLYKVHSVTGSAEMIPNLPDHCIIDNENELTINDIDRQWYIDLATERADRFTRKGLNYMDKYVRLSELAEVTGIGEKTMERVLEQCEILTSEDFKTEEKTEDLSWLDDLLTN